jgi:Leucine-rich repeat (LRR) protein
MFKKLKFLLADGSNIIMENQLDNFVNLTNLEYLSLKRRKINTASYFSQLTKLRELSLDGCDISNLTPMENLTQMEKLDLTGNSKLKDISPLYKMSNINTLLLGGGKGDKMIKGTTSIATMNVDNIEVVRNFKKLVTIDLGVNPRLKNINPLEACQDLEEVELQNCVQLEDVSVLGNLKKLKKIILTSNSRIKDISFVRYLPNLEELNFNGTMVSTPGIATILRKYGKIKTLVGNDADMLFQISLLSGKKKSKLQKIIMKYFGKKN